MAICCFCDSFITRDDPDYRTARWSESMDRLVVAHRRCLKDHNRKMSREAFLRVARRRSRKRTVAPAAAEDLR